MVLMYSRSFSSPSASIFAGVSATANSARVALLTPASVACADRTTATRSVKGLRCSSSPLGSGLSLRKRLKASRTSAGVHGRNALDLPEARACLGGRPALAADLPIFCVAASGPERFLARFETTDFALSKGLRVIFAMVGVY